MISPAKHDENQDVMLVIEAIVRDGNHMADLVSRFLNGWFKSLGLKPAPLPAEFLLELSAVIRVARWQRAALTGVLGVDFPSWQHLLRELLVRLLENPMSFSFDPNVCPAPLARRVGWLWFQHCSWTAPAVLGAEMVVHAGDKELLLDALADVLWKHRHLGRRE